MNGTRPALLADGRRIAENAARVVERCEGAGIGVTAVTKGVCAREEIVRAMREGGSCELADSRVANLAILKGLNTGLPLLLLRIPMLSEIPAVVSLADTVLVSMPETVRALGEECRFRKTERGVIVMMDLGDLREGLWMDLDDSMVSALKECRRVRCRGLGVNFGCFGGSLPTAEKLRRLAAMGRELEKELGYPLDRCSGGSTSSLALLEKGLIPEGITNLRVGEGILLGTDVTNSRKIPWLHQGTMRLEAELVEVRRKPSVPLGPLGADAFGRRPSFPDRGERLRAIAAVGRQDVPMEGLVPEAEGVEILGGSSDHMLLDVEDMRPEPHTGDVMRFSPDYGAMLALATSPYVRFEVV